MAQWLKNLTAGTSLVDPVGKNPPYHADDASWIPGWGTKIPHAAEQLSPLAATTESACRSQRVRVPQRETIHDSVKMLRATTTDRVR